MLTDRQTNIQTDITENNTTVVARVVKSLALEPNISGIF